ncbi:MAG: hypothetical protein FJ296_07510 [Planctomycetes bacterium]|nr:hypothetical protein [Planctomycetota bacterium]
MSVRTLALCLALAAPAAGQEFLYGLNVHGKLTVNGTVLDSLPTDFDPDTGQFDVQQWLALDVVGPDRHALRYDGRLHLNGKKTQQFAMGLDGTTLYGWRSLDATDNAVHLLRQDGLRVKDDASVVTYPRGNFFFSALLAQTVQDADTLYALRSDGSVYSGTSTNPVARFKAAVGGEPADGAEIETRWIDLSLDTVPTKLYALRADGRLWSVSLADVAAFIAAGSGDPPGGTQVGALPFPAADATFADLYHRVAYGDGTWRVLQATGAVYTSASVLDPLVDYAGDGFDAGAFLALATSGADAWALRADGFLFKNEAAGEEILDLAKSDYGGWIAGPPFTVGADVLAVGSEPPDLSSFKNPQPKAAPYKVTLRELVPASVPVLVADVEKLPADLVVTEDPDAPLPAGVTFEEADDGEGGLLRTLEWDGTAPAGTWPCRLIVDDGVTKPRKFTTTIKVKPADLDPLKNKPPVPAGIKQVLALVGHEVRIPILADDPDGDALEITVNEAKYPFTEEGAAFDTVTDVFTWTPTFDDIGVKSVKFFVSDLVKTKTRTVKVKVISPLIFE